MTMKIARWLATYALGVSIALAIWNVMSGALDWSLVVFSVLFSGAIYYYVNYVIDPQVARRQEEAAKVALTEATTEKEAEGKSKVKRRPKIKRL